MKERHIIFLVVGLAALILARVALNLLFDPLADTREELARALAEVPADAPLSTDNAEDFARLTQTINAVPTLWNEIVAPPPPAVPPPPPKPNAPDLKKMLSTISVGKGQIGTSKIKIYTPQAPRGDWLERGDVLLGCTLKSFTREKATFTYYWKEGQQTLEVTLPRN